MEYHHRITQCWNGSDCRFLARGNCTFFHAPEHSQRRSMNHQSGYTRTNLNRFGPRETQQSNWNRQYRPNESSYRRNENFGLDTFTRNSQPRSTNDLHLFIAQSLFPTSIHHQNNPNFTFQQYLHLFNSSSTINRTGSFNREIIVEPINQNERMNTLTRRTVNQLNQRVLNNPDLSNKDQNFQWFFNKNKIFKAHQLRKDQLQKFDQCSICFEQFVSQKSNISEEVEHNETREKFSQKEQNKLEQFLRQMPKKQERSEQKAELKDGQIIELFCKHIYHKECIQNWLKSKSQCAVCRKDFRQHSEYEKWDKDYKRRIKPEEPILFTFPVRQSPVVEIPNERRVFPVNQYENGNEEENQYDSDLNDQLMIDYQHSDQSESDYEDIQVSQEEWR